MRIGITGANSSVGRNLLRYIAVQQGVTAVAGVRTQHAAGALPPADNIRPVVVSYRNVAGLAAAFDGVDSLVHLAGVLFQRQAGAYRSANVETTGAVVEAARQAQLRHVVFISALGAAAGAANAYLRSKGEAEHIVTASGLSATVIRTPLLMGPDTAGGRALHKAAAGRRVAVLAGGRYTVRPLDVDDLSAAILHACAHPPDAPTTFELVGPTPIRYRDLIQRTADMMGRQVTITAVPVWGAKLLAGASYLVTRRGISPAIIDVITADERVARNADRDLGISLTPLSETLEKIVDSASGGRP